MSLRLGYRVFRLIHSLGSSALHYSAGSGFQPLASGRMPLPLFQTLEKFSGAVRPRLFAFFAISRGELKPHAFGDDAFEFVDGNADLLHGVTVAQGDGAACKTVKRIRPEGRSGRLSGFCLRR
jgi:hypothetical protein